jgi:hypothetical protein
MPPALNGQSVADGVAVGRGGVAKGAAVGVGPATAAERCGVGFANAACVFELDRGAGACVAAALITAASTGLALTAGSWLGPA